MSVGYTVLFVKELRASQQGMNDLIARSFASAGVPFTKEPSRLFRTDWKRPDGLTLVLWQSGKSMCWDVTVICPLAESYVNGVETLSVFNSSARLLLNELSKRISAIFSEAREASFLLQRPRFWCSV